MCAVDEQSAECDEQTQARVELVDPAHVNWPRVLELIDQLGHRPALRLSDDGDWLSARQQVLAAFVDGEPAGMLCFHVHAVGREDLEARLDAFGLRGNLDCPPIGQALRDAALEHARSLRCSRFTGLKTVTV
jgi:hypothetical protein